jgi:hypothetical protein
VWEDFFLDAQAEVYVLLVAGVSVEVVGGAAVELVALAEFAADEEAERNGSETGGDPSYGLDESGFFVLFFPQLKMREGQRCSNRKIPGSGVIGPRLETKLHGMDDIPGSREMGERTFWR